MKRLNWTTTKKTCIGKYNIPCSEELVAQTNHVAGIRRDSKLKLILKTILWPALNLRNDLLVDGFIERNIGRWIKQLFTDDTVCLEVGSGDMSLRRFWPKNTCYNAFDFSFSEFQLLRVLRKSKNINIAIASATNIPLESNSVSLIISTEVFEHIPEIDRAVDEIHRIAMPGAKLICSIPNNYCYKYEKKGPHAQHVNNWTYDGFKDFMARHNFKFVKGHMKGFWIPLPLWLTETSYQLPISSSNEFYNTNFFFIFEA